MQEALDKPMTNIDRVRQALAMGEAGYKTSVSLEEAEALLASHDRIVEAGRKVLAHLNDRIDAAPDNAKPVFLGIADLHDAVNASL